LRCFSIEFKVSVQGSGFRTEGIGLRVDTGAVHNHVEG